MRTLVVLLVTVAYAVAEPPLLFRHDIPHVHGFGLGSPFHGHSLPIVRNVIPIHLSYAPHYTGFKSLYDDRDYTGQARYGHIEPGQLHHAVQDAYGNKIGGFSYYNAEGKLVQTSYIADASGYRVSSNDLPLDTPEVLAAKAAHFAEYEKIRSRSKRDAPFLLPASTTRFLSPVPITSVAPHAFPTTHTIPVVKPDGFLADTPEVAAAKSQHFAELEAAKVRNYSPFSPITPIAPVSHFDYRFASPFSYAPVPVVKPDGYLADTPEVAAAKSLHFAEVAKARARSGFIF